MIDAAYEHVERRVLEVVRENSGSTKVSVTSTFDSLGIDSLDIVEVVMDLENEFDFLTTDDQVEGLIRVQDLVDLVMGYGTNDG